MHGPGRKTKDIASGHRGPLSQSSRGLLTTRHNSDITLVAVRGGSIADHHNLRRQASGHPP